MVKFKRHVGALLALLTFCLVAACAHLPAPQRPTLQVMTSGGFAAAYDALALRFEKSSRITLVATYGASMGGAPDSIPVRLARGDAADVVIMAKAGIDELATKGLVDPASITDLVRSEIGMAVKTGAPVPIISTRTAFMETLLSARSIGYSASASGRYLSTDLFPSLEIYPQIRSKLVRVESERVAAVVARGDVEIGFQQVSEILPVQGITFVGRIPAAFQLTTTFSAGIIARSQKKPGARRLIAYFASPQVAETIRTTGLDPIAGASGK